LSPVGSGRDKSNISLGLLVTSELASEDEAGAEVGAAVVGVAVLQLAKTEIVIATTSRIDSFLFINTLLKNFDLIALYNISM
jgi:hypothetical protein